MKFNEKIVLITGGASGIGRIMGELALKKGASALVIWDINQANIDATIADMKAFGKVVGYRVDVSDYNMVEASYAQVKGEVGDVDILINSAGIITSNRTFDLCSVEEMDRTIKVNTLAPMYVTRQVLPDMIKRNSGHICNIGSAGGMLPNPKMSIKDLLSGRLCDKSITMKMLSCIDILVDGKFVEEKKNLKLRFKGSENQRIIDVQKSMQENRIILWEGDINAV